MERLRGEQHHVVRDVDDVADRAHARPEQPRLQPRRGRRDRDVGEHAGAEPGAQVGHFDGDRGVVGGRPLPRRLRVAHPRRGRELGAGHRVELARDAVNAEAVHPVRGRLQLDDRLGDGEDLGERGSRRGAVGEDHDPVVVLPQPKLLLGQDHPVRFDPPQLRLAELRAVGHHRAGQRHGNGLARGDVRGAADDRPRAIAGLDLADAQPIRVRVLLSAQHGAHDEAIGARSPQMRDPLELDRVHRERLADLLRRQPRVAVLGQPGVGSLQRNCSSTRTSFSKNLRRSGIPCLSIAIRSIPMPKANPWTRSGS